MINFIKAIAGRGRTFLDIGSHIGFYTMSLAPGFDRVIAFEPSRFQYGWLTRNRALNDYTHVMCEHVALGETPGEAKLHVLSYEGGLNSLSVEVASEHALIDSYTVPVERLDDRGLTDVDLMKIDVEGFEIPVLRGARNTIASEPAHDFAGGVDGPGATPIRARAHGRHGVLLRAPVSAIAGARFMPATRAARGLQLVYLSGTATAKGRGERPAFR